MYEGKKVRLRALRREDAPFFVRWMNSYETQRNLGGQPHPLNLQDEERWIDSACTRDDEHPFAVETLDGQLLSGGLGHLRPRPARQGLRPGHDRDAAALLLL